ncbi:MAG TPA: DUF3857 and transglutaminase domain-containing protein [Blastocatellia bacterium]|nr:DUF3857 and transglutaminase domain-containing protein [Blastocatellia bacterium]
MLSLFALALMAGAERAAANWKAITPQDLRLTALDIGDPEADAAILFREGELNDNTGEGTSLKVYIRIKIFNERGRRFADIQLPYKVELGKITDVRARTIRPDGTVIEVEGRDIFDKLLLKTRHGVWRARVFSMPAVSPGSIIEYRYRQTYPKGFRYFALDLQSELFTKTLSYRIQPQAESSFEVRWVTFNAPDAKRFDPTWDGTYNIRADNIPPFRREPLMPPELTVKMWGWLYYSNELETNPEKYWRNYGRRMYDRAIYETRSSGAIRRVLDSILLAGDGPQDKVARIYNYVQTEIQNIGIRQPSAEENSPEFKTNDSADDTIRRRYGTPREINRLFISMLRAAGFEATVAELTTRDENYFHRSFPDAFQFNSEVTAVVGRDGALQFYDPGTPYCPLGMLSWEKEGVTALVYDKRNPRFVETPVSDAARSSAERNLTVSAAADGSVAARVEAKFTGQRGLEFRGEMVDLTAEEQRKQVIDAVREVLPNATVNEPSVVVSNLTSAAAMPGLSYSFTAPQFAARTEKRLLLRPALLIHRDESLLAAPRRANSVYFNYPWSEDERFTIEIPEGYDVEQLPEPVDIDIGAARYQAAFTRQERRVIYERKLTVNAIIFTVAQYPTIKEFFDRAHQADRAVISLKQP